MAKLPWTPWHKVVKLREDLKTGELSLAVFAADLYQVALQKGQRPVYEKPAEFFALTYPTYNLRELAKDMCQRLAGKNDKAVRQLELTYGGGKTHTLITLYHLVNDPETLPDLPAVSEFLKHMDMKPPKTRVAALSFDKLDVEKGMEVRGPNGKLRWLKQPWSVLAFQIAGSEGLKLLHADNKDAERESAPAENLLTDLLALPQKEGLATLVLIDEVLMYAREKVGLDPVWRDRLINFFQYLTQAATKVDRCCIVASLLATDPLKSDDLGKALTKELYDVFRREREESIQPVLKEDVAEVLRRRFFTPDSIRDLQGFRPDVMTALKGIQDLDEQTKKEGKAAEERYLASFPFHPELTEVLYSKWTNLEGFQRTRGVLRTFALALRGAEDWDESPLIGVNVFLGKPKKDGISEGARELTSIATSDGFDGKIQNWEAILLGEMEKARGFQQEFPGLKHRELEQAVFATFVHSQPIGQKGQTRDLMVLLGSTRPDKIDLTKALLKWAEVSWFLDEGLVADKDASSLLPKFWRLGSKPNLRQMHHDACGRVTPDIIEAKLIDTVEKAKRLTEGASAMGVKVHNLPIGPSQIDDDGEFHYAVLGPKAASDASKPSAEAKRFLDETTAPDRPRVNRNAVVLAVPSRDGLEAARNQIRIYLGWEEVRSQLKDQSVDPIRDQILSTFTEQARKSYPEAVRQAYSIVVAVGTDNQVQAFRVTAGDGPLFNAIKADKRSRIQETQVSAEALLPEGPYDLWKDGETARWAKDLVGAFAQHPHLPKMLNRRAIQDTLSDGCQQGLFVLRLTRPDRTVRTFWRLAPDEAALKEPGLEVVLPEVAELAELPAQLLSPNVLPGLWSDEQFSYQTVIAYFAGGHRVVVGAHGESLIIPKVSDEFVKNAVAESVASSRIWLVSGPASLYGEDVPEGILTVDALLYPPPKPIPTPDLLQPNLPEAWSGQGTNAQALYVALSKKAGRALPWKTVHTAIDGAIHARFIERAADSGEWPCDFGSAAQARFCMPGMPPPPPPPPPPVTGRRVAEAEMTSYEIQELSEKLSDIKKASAGHSLRYHIRVELGDGKEVPPAVAEKVQEILNRISEKLNLKQS